MFFGSEIRVVHGVAPGAMRRFTAMPPDTLIIRGCAGCVNRYVRLRMCANRVCVPYL